MTEDTPVEIEHLTFSGIIIGLSRDSKLDRLTNKIPLLSGGRITILSSNYPGYNYKADLEFNVQEKEYKKALRAHLDQVEVKITAERQSFEYATLINNVIIHY